MMRTFDALVMMLAGLSSSSTADPEIITVDHHFSGIVCAGFCTDSHLMVRSDGLVELSVTPLGSKTIRNRFTITAQEFAEFRRVYRAIRPTGLKGPVGNCDEGTVVIDWDIRWDGPDRSSRLLACRDIEEVRKAYVEGYRILRIWPGTAKRVSKETVEDIH